MKITILCVGKIKEAFYRDALAEYLKRMSRYAKVEIIEVADEKTPDKINDNQKELILEKEAQRILDKLDRDSLKVTLEIQGKSYTSEEFAQFFSKAGIDGISHITFIIGGSLGLHSTVLNISNYPLSFSKMTFPHKLMRVILLEQIYRAYRINSNEPYHK